MCCRFFRRLAGFTDRVVDDALLYQICFAFDSLLGEQPRKEFDSWRSLVLPDKLCPGVRS